MLTVSIFARAGRRVYLIAHALVAAAAALAVVASLSAARAADMAAAPSDTQSSNTQPSDTETSDTGISDAAPSDAQIEAAARDRLWRVLTRSVEPVLPTGRRHSDVVTDGYLYTDRASFDPAGELKRTIAEMQAPPLPGVDPDGHAVCRFPARAAFIRTRLAVRIQSDEMCTELRAWRRDGNIDGVSVILASGHLSNPGSFYGHLLLKFNAPDDGPLSSDLLDTAINYGAVFPENENPLVYIAKGIAGGYVSRFTHLEYFNHNHNYAESQLRDVWEYELNLTPDETALVVNHVWELLSAGNRYFFIRQNCAYRIAEVISILTDENLLPNSKFWATPVDVFDRMMSIERDGEPFVRRVSRLPSRQNRFREAYFSLPVRERTQVRALVESGDASATLNGLGAVDAASAARISETALDYYAFADAKNKGPTPESIDQRNALLRARLALPQASGPAIEPNTENARAPHTGHKSSMVQVRFVTNTELGEGADIRFRPVYSDFLSLAPGTLPFSELSLLDARIRIMADDLTLRRVDVVRVTTLNPSATGLPDDGGIAWRFRLGAEARELACKACLVGFLDGGVGKAKAIGRQSAVYALANVRGRAGANNDSYLQAGASAGLVAGLSDSVAIAGEGGVWREIDGAETSAFARLEARFGASPKVDFRLSTDYETGIAGDGALEVSAGFSYFW